jgi:protoheme IX farnesyltransferase
MTTTALRLPAAWVRGIVELTKPELTALSVFTAAGAAFLAAGHEQGFLQPIALTVVGTAMVGGGAGALNQYLERSFDALMKRTEHRPIPSGRVSPVAALLVGLLLSGAGIALLLVGTRPLAGLLALVTLVAYLGVYTPLKRTTPFATVVGGIPGALPPLIGWTAVRGDAGPEAWSLFAILFFWQMPHFLSLAWMYRKDYERGGYPMLTVVDPSGDSVARQMLVYSIALLPAAVMPFVVGLLGFPYFCGALILTLLFFARTFRFTRTRTNDDARRVFFGSLVYLLALVSLMALDRVL